MDLEGVDSTVLITLLELLSQTVQSILKRVQVEMCLCNLALEFRVEHVDVPLPFAPAMESVPSTLIENDVAEPMVDTDVDHGVG